MKRLVTVVLVLTTIGCSAQSDLKTIVEQPVLVEVQENEVPGTVNDVWEAPIYDTVRVPAQLDPTGTYYRPNHQTIVEIYPGRVQPVQYPHPKQERSK